MADEMRTLTRAYMLAGLQLVPAIATPKLPEAPLVAAGTIGGPLVIGMCTPMSNAGTLAAQDAHSTIPRIYRRVFSTGFLGAWTGGAAPAAAAAVAFTMLGPGYHFILGQLSSPWAAVACAGLLELPIVYGPEVRNCQLIHNRLCPPAERVPLLGMRLAGPGAVANLGRCYCNMAGIRLLSEPLERRLALLVPRMAEQSGTCKVLADFLASLGSGALSMPLHQLFTYQVTSNACLAAGPIGRLRLGLHFLRGQYIATTATGLPVLSRTAARDTLLRASYVGVLFSSYAAVERLAVAMWRA